VVLGLQVSVLRLSVVRVHLRLQAFCRLQQLLLLGGVSRQCVAIFDAPLLKEVVLSAPLHFEALPFFPLLLLIVLQFL